MVDILPVSACSESLVLPQANASLKKRTIMMEVSSSPPEDSIDDADFSEMSGFRRVRVSPTEEGCQKQADMLKNGRVMEAHAASFNLNDPDGHGNAASEGLKESTELALGSNSANGGFGNQCVRPLGCSLLDKEKKGKGLLLRLGSGSFNDDRSHWDLNSPMDLWEKQPRVCDAESGQGLHAGISCSKSLENLDGIQVQTLVVEAKGKIRKAEQDMLSKGFQAHQGPHELGFFGGLPSEENAELDTHLGLRPDMVPGPGEKPLKRARVTKNDVGLEESVVEGGLNLCMASFEGVCNPASDVSTPEVEGKLPDVNSETQLLQGDSLPGGFVIGSQVCLSDHLEDYPALKHDGRVVRDGLDAINGICVRENQSGHLKTDDHLDARVKCLVFSKARDGHNVETMEEDRFVLDESNVDSGKDDGAVLVKDTNTTRGKPATLEVGLGKQSTKYNTEAGCAGDYKHNVVDEPAADVAEEVLGQAGGGFQDREHRKTREEMEVAHGDSGDSDCRGVADDAGIGFDSDERREGGGTHGYQ